MKTDIRLGLETQTALNETELTPSELLEAQLEMSDCRGRSPS